MTRGDDRFEFRFRGIGSYRFEALKNGERFLDSKPDSFLLPNRCELKHQNETVGTWKCDRQPFPMVRSMVQDKPFNLFLKGRIESYSEPFSYVLQTGRDDRPYFSCQYVGRRGGAACKVSLSENAESDLSEIESVAVRALAYFACMRFIPAD